MNNEQLLREPIKTFLIRHCEGDSPKPEGFASRNQSIEIQYLKKILIFLTFLLWIATFSVQSQSAQYLWPIDGAKTGDNIISAPQSYIGNELNFDNLFIGAPEGTTVLSPVDGTITHISVGYRRSLNNTVSCSPCYEKNFEESLLKNSSKFDIPGGSKFFNGFLGIRSKDGKMIWFCGLSGSETFKTGQTVKRGEPIGTVSYSYFKIDEPSIILSISIGRKPSDPMTPFGVKSTFVPVRENIKPILSLTGKQAKEDFMIYINILKEAYPGLYDVVTEVELDEYIKQTTDMIESKRENLKFTEFYEIMKAATAKIHDSHIYLLPLVWKTENKPSMHKRSIEFGLINDTLVCTNATVKNRQIINRQIKLVNGMSADSIKRIVASTVSVYDAKVESYIDYHLALASFFSGLDNDLNVEFTDGEAVYFEAVDKETTFDYSLNSFHKINKHQDSYRTRFLNDSTAYIGLSNFSLTQVQVEKIANFINNVSIYGTPNLIIDLRNNGGGHDWVVEKLYSYIAGDSLIINSYSRVNRRSGYKSFKYSLNRTTDDDSFSYYVAEEGKEGFYNRSENVKTIVADSLINYKGNVYVMINEISASAAAIFAAMLVRNHRGTVVGRETRTAFHFMNALKFADIRLPNSMIRINMPLVQNVFDTVVNERTPYGRGVLPDYPVPITIDELSFKNGDAILNYTLKLIEDRENLSNNETKSSGIFFWILLILIAFSALGYLFYRYKYER